MKLPNQPRDLPRAGHGQRRGNCAKSPVLLLGCIPRIIIPIARSLQRHGVPVDVACFGASTRVASSVIVEYRSLPRPELDRTGFIGQLRRFISERGHDMLIPTDDWRLAAVIEHYDALADLLHIACPPPAITRFALDKAATLKIAESCGIVVPRTVIASRSSELGDLIGEFSFPWVVKPSRREASGKEELKACRLTTAVEVAARFPPGRDFAPPLLVQEYCSGAGVGVEVLLHKGECLAAFQHRRLKEFPYTGGYSVMAIAEPVNEDLLRASLTLLRALRWDGIAMVEYKVDHDGRAVLMEVNGRYWGTIALPIFAGLDFPFYHWQLVHDQHPEIPKTYAAGTKWRWTAGYIGRLYFLLANVSHSVEAREALGKDVRHVFEDFSPSVSDAMLKSSDPMASLLEFLQATRDYAGYTARRLFDRAGINNSHA